MEPSHRLAADQTWQTLPRPHHPALTSAHRPRSGLRVLRGIPSLTTDVPHQAVQKQKPRKMLWWSWLLARAAAGQVNKEACQLLCKTTAEPCGVTLFNRPDATLDGVNRTKTSH